MNLSVLTDEGLALYAQNIEQIVNRASAYEHIMNLPEGKFLLAEFKSDLEQVRTLYFNLIPEQRDVGVALCGLQAEEFYIKRCISRLGDRNNLEAYAQKERKAVKDELERRRQKRKESETRSEFRSSRSRRGHEQDAGAVGS